IGYISATKQWAFDHGADWEKWWKADDTRLLHFIGKDNIVFHAIIFPILLKEHGGFILPQNVPANEFLNLEGQKLSTSRNWAVWLHEYIERWPDRQDELRYALATILPEFRDSEFTWKDFQDKNNNELVAIIGNFVQRVFVLCNKYYGGKVPEPAPSNAAQGEQDTVLWGELSAIPGKVAEDIDKFRFRDALLTAMNAARLGNKYLTDTEPWKLHKTDPDRVRTVLFNSLRITAALSVVLEPFLPFTAQKLRAMLGLGELNWGDALREGLMVPGAAIAEAVHLFKPISDEEIAAEVDRLKSNTPVVQQPPATATAPVITPGPAMKANIGFDEFTKLDIRIGTIKEAEKVPKADKLLKLSIDVGETAPRTIVSGIAQHFAPDELPGKQVLVLCNLEPRKMRGVESQGMVLMAEDAEGKLVFVQPGSAVPPGGEVR
ncbi:MAG TPA: methionine--tRNA ligase subunit beta, partial [Flavobacteriales bacterium]|nr:methionine--tRNA ligase subunit beta [Flavobacteriales bacterium]